MTQRIIKVLVAEDSTVTRMFLVHLLESDPQIRVIGAVNDGQAALEFVMNELPDVVLMDIHMPRMDGFEATRRIMQTRAVPIVICSATADTSDVVITFHAMEAGAIACIEKPLGQGHEDFEAKAAHLLETIRLMSEIKMVRRIPRPQAAAPLSFRVPDTTTVPSKVNLIGIGASTGGPPVLQTILSSLPKNFPVPLLIVQHISPGFLAGMAQWLTQTTGQPVLIASHGTSPLPGHAYLAPDGFHLEIDSTGAMTLSRAEPEHHLRPAVSALFRSLGRVHGPNAIGVLLTGMGRDGAEQLKVLKDLGATTIAQDKDSSVVHGMPGVAIALGGATHVLPATEIAGMLATLVQQRNATSKR